MRHRLAQTAVLKLKVLEPLHLFDLQPAELLAPAIECHLANADLADRCSIPDSAMYLTFVMFCVNGLCFSLAALTSLARQYAGVRRFYKQHGRLIVIADVQLTMVSLAFMWLAVVGII